VNRNHGSNFPILNLHERTLSVLACRVCCTPLCLLALCNQTNIYG
jgi:hypothetical protein